MTTESPVQVKAVKTPISAKKHRRKLFLSSEKAQNQTDENIEPDQVKAKLDSSFEGLNFFFDFCSTLFFSSGKGNNPNTLANAPADSTWQCESGAASVTIIGIGEVTLFTFNP